MKHALGWPTRAAATVALAAWAYSSTANTTIWRSLELINAQELNSQNSLEVEPAADDAWQCTDDNITANTADWSSLELDVDVARRDAIRTEFAWSWHAACHTARTRRWSCLPAASRRRGRSTLF